MTTKLTTAAAAAGLAVALLAGTAEAATQTFTNVASIAIPGSGTSGPANPYPSVIDVAGINGTVTDVDVLLNGLSHTWASDIEIAVEGPDATTTFLMDSQGGAANWTNNALRFSDDGANLSVGTSGTYAPFGSLAVFNGLEPNGAWKLYVRDNAGADTGSISGGWSVEITYDPATVPLPATLPLLGAALGAAGLAARRRQSSH